MLSYRRMYREITAKIIDGEPGDSLESVERSARLVLEVEERLRKSRGPSVGKTELVAGMWKEV